MIICLCTPSTDRDVRGAIAHGARSVSEVQRCGIGTGCGSCHDLIRTMIRQAACEESSSLWTSLHPAEQEPVVATA